MSKTIRLLLMAIVLMAIGHTAARADKIGSWKAYPAYGDMEQIEVAGDIVYAISNGNLFAYNTADQSIETFTKMDLLNDCSISMIKWCPTPKLLMIFYDNGDIDFMSREGSVTNLAAYQNSSSARDKTVNQLTPSGQNVLMSTNFGIVVLNAPGAYVVDTYSIGCAIYSVVETDSHIYAASSEGLMVGNKSDNLLDPSSWKVLCPTVYKHLAMLQGQLFAIKSGECSQIDTTTGAATTLFAPYFYYVWTSDQRVVISGSDYTCVVCGLKDYFVLHEEHGPMAYAGGTEYYTTDSEGRLSRIDMRGGQLPSVTMMTGVRPDGPQSPYFGFLKYADGKLYCGTGYNESVPGAVQILRDGEWTVLPDDMEATTGARYLMTFAIAEDPLEEDHLMVGTKSGLYEFRGGEFVKRYGLENSPLQPASTVSSNLQENVFVPGVCYDSEGTLWLTNGQSETTSLLSMSRDGSFTSHHKSELMTKQGWSMFHLGGMMIDSRGLLWACNNNHVTPALVCYQPSTDGIRVYKNFVNQDGTEISLSYVCCVAEDTEGNIWAGTNHGPLMLPSDDIAESSTSGDVFTQVKVPRDDGSGLADYLMSGEYVTSIAIDKANRKWMGTNGDGVYVISPDNLSQLYHFTSENSSLLSDYIESLAIDTETGEVFIGTTYGLCSYQSDISVMPDKMDKSTAWAYPNPVEPGFSGSVTICGLSYGADVKIVTSAGTLVAEGTSSGGTFEWDCRDKKGRRVASGVYMVETAEPDGSAGCVCKIAVVN